MLDRDLAELYGVSTKVLNQAVKRNIGRFPLDFMFQITEKEWDILRSQIVTSSLRHGGMRYLPFVFTEQGVSALSGVLKSKKAIEVNIKIIRAFVSMRKFISKNSEIFFRLDKVERKQIEYDDKFEKIFDALEVEKPKKGIFYEGQVFDAYRFVSDLIKSAKVKIILIDNYVDESVLTLFSKVCDVKVVIYTHGISKQLKLDLKKYNSQYGNVKIKEFSDAHDRFLIIDEEVYHFGASLKDLGKKWFAFSKFPKKSVEIINKLK